MLVRCVVVLALVVARARVDARRYAHELASARADDFECARVPPALWCKSATLAERCGFADACRTYTSAAHNSKLRLTLFYESLCHGCQQFITGPLLNDVHANLAKYVHIELLPYGNTQRTKGSNFTCQHGPAECEANMHESCAIHFLLDPLPYIACLEKKLEGGTQLDDACKTCLKKTKSPLHTYDQILHCVKGNKGRELQSADAARTESAWPDKHTQVPWIVFNNASLADAQILVQNPAFAICDAIVGDKPDYCFKIASAHRNTIGYCKQD